MRENPIRPEIAIFRRTMRRASPATIDGLVEEVLDTLDDHAIFYCLTVKEVIRLHAHLREYLGDAGLRDPAVPRPTHRGGEVGGDDRVPRGTAPGRGRLCTRVVVATSAFGLGINRPDIRTVFCVSPATDLAALYQHWAGRDGTRPPEAALAPPAR